MLGLVPQLLEDHALHVPQAKVSFLESAVVAEPIQLPCPREISVHYRLLSRLQSTLDVRTPSVMAHRASRNARQESMYSARSHQAALSSSISVKQLHAPQIVENALGQQLASANNATRVIILN